MNRREFFKMLGKGSIAISGFIPIMDFSLDEDKEIKSTAITTVTNPSQVGSDNRTFNLIITQNHNQDIIKDFEVLKTLASTK